MLMNSSSTGYVGLSTDRMPTITVTTTDSSTAKDKWISTYYIPASSFIGCGDVQSEKKDTAKKDKKSSAEKEMIEVPRVKRIIHNGPATIVFWKDGTRTVVKCMDGTVYDEYAAFTAAVCKKVYGSSAICKREGGFKRLRSRRHKVEPEKTPLEELADATPKEIGIMDAVPIENAGIDTAGPIVLKDGVFLPHINFKD